MSIGFNDIPNNIRVPLTYIEFDNSGAITGTPAMQYQLLVIGTKIDSTPGYGLTTITSADQAKELYGRGSMLANMCDIALRNAGLMRVVALPVFENNQGIAGQSSITINSSAIKTAMLSLSVGGRIIRFLIEEGMLPMEIADIICDAINADLDCHATATSGEGKVTLTMKYKGEGQPISLGDLYNHIYYGEAKGEWDTVFAPGSAADFEINETQGAGNPVLSDQLVEVTGQFNAIAMPYNDSDNLDALRDHLLEQWGPLKMQDGIAFLAKEGEFAEVSTFGEGRNDFLYSCMFTGLSGTPSYLWAAAIAGAAAKSLSIDPARPLQTLPIKGVRQMSFMFPTLQERNLLLYSGISTHNLDAGGNVLIERLITMYRKNALGSDDPSYLDVNTPATLSYLRYSTRARIQLKFPRYKLADNGTLVAPGQPIVTPNIIKAELIALAKEWEEQGLVENIEDYKNDLLVERNSADKNRVDVLARPDLINQFRIFAEQIRFIL